MAVMNVVMGLCVSELRNFVGVLENFIIRRGHGVLVVFLATLNRRGITI